MEPRSRTGVFAGYSLKSGYKWDGYYLVWDLKDFVGKDLHAQADCSRHRGTTLHRVKGLIIPTDGVVFPLKDEYVRQNDTLAGVGEEADSQNHLSRSPRGLATASVPRGAGYMWGIIGITYTPVPERLCSYQITKKAVRTLTRFATDVLPKCSVKVVK